MNRGDAPKVCRTCRWWDMYSLGMKAGECRVPGSGNSGIHRYGRVRMPDGSFALWDSFGPEKTKPDYTCGAWDDGAMPGNRKDGSSLKSPTDQNGEPS